MGAANADQSEFWNAEPGLEWVRFQCDLDLLLRDVTDLLLGACAPRDGEAILDVGCGAGASSLALARAVAPSGGVQGIDISAPLLERARERAGEQGLRNASFLQADAQHHPLGPGRFDLAASRFGVMFFSDPVAAFRNLAACLRPGGRIAFVAWDALDRNPWFAWPQRIALDRLGERPPPPSDAPGPMAFRDIGRVVAILRAAGLTACRGRSVAVDLHHPDGAKAVVRLAPHIGPLARILREGEATEEDRSATLDAIAAEFGRLDGPGGIRIPARVNLFTARAP